MGFRVSLCRFGVFDFRAYGFGVARFGVRGFAFVVSLPGFRVFEVVGYGFGVSGSGFGLGVQDLVFWGF